MCTNFKVPVAKDGSVVVGRSLEFPNLLPTALSVLPRAFEGAATLPAGSPAGVTWTSSYGVVGMCAFGKPAAMLDGLNTAGLSAHALYMPGYCTYQPSKGDGSDISEMDLMAFLLGTCATTAEVKAAMAGKNVVGIDPGMGFPPPLHFLIHDTDSSIAIEFHPEGWTIVDNPTSVGTNSPYMEWHLTNLNNYVGMTATNPEPQKAFGTEFDQFGQGAGLMGLPGDYTPPARFVRAAVLTALADQPHSSPEAEQTALHILNSFDIVGGTIKEAFGKAGEVNEVTCWDTIVNLTGQRYAYRTVSDPTVYVVDLATTDFTTPARVVDLRVNGGFTAITV